MREDWEVDVQEKRDGTWEFQILYRGALFGEGAGFGSEAEARMLAAEQMRNRAWLKRCEFGYWREHRN